MDKSDNSNIMDSDDMLMLQSLEEYEMLMENQYLFDTATGDLDLSEMLMANHPNVRNDEDIDFGIYT
jgi:hypothetical protein